jgi:hypothetical protein
MCMDWETVTDYLFYLFYILLLYSFTVTAICCGHATDPCPSIFCELGKFSLLGSIDLWMCLILTVCLLRIFYVSFVGMQILKDGMQHVEKLICSNLGARMDSEPKSWRILGMHLWL